LRLTDDFLELDSGALDLEDRNALRRVAGLSTELADVTEVEYRQLRLERVVLVGVWTEGTVEDAENSLSELAALADTAGAAVLDGLIQRRQRPDPSTYIGRGKVDDLRTVVVDTGVDTVICDGELSPSQLRKASRLSGSAGADSAAVEGGVSIAGAPSLAPSQARGASWTAMSTPASIHQPSTLAASAAVKRSCSPPMSRILH